MNAKTALKHFIKAVLFLFCIFRSFIIKKMRKTNKEKLKKLKTTYFEILFNDNSNNKFRRNKKKNKKKIVGF